MFFVQPSLLASMWSLWEKECVSHSLMHACSHIHLSLHLWACTNTHLHAHKKTGEQHIGRRLKHTHAPLHTPQDQESDPLAMDPLDLIDGDAENDRVDEQAQQEEEDSTMMNTGMTRSDLKQVGGVRVCVCGGGGCLLACMCHACGYSHVPITDVVLRLRTARISDFVVSSCFVGIYSLPLCLCAGIHEL